MDILQTSKLENDTVEDAINCDNDADCIIAAKKDMMRKYMGDLVDTKLSHLFTDENNHDVNGILSGLNIFVRTRTTILQKCCIYLFNGLDLLDYIKEYVYVFDTVNDVDSEGWNVLHYVVALDNHSGKQSTHILIQYFITCGVDINKQSNFGNTPIYFSENVNTMKYLIDNGASIDIKNINGIMPTDYNKKLKILSVTSKKNTISAECIICLETNDCISCDFNHLICSDCIIKVSALNCMLCSKKY